MRAKGAPQPLLTFLNCRCLLTATMSVFLISLRGVPDDEADEIRALLDANAISFYETPAGRWGISAPAIWLREERNLKRAKSLIEEYEQDRFTRQRAEYERLRREGKNRTFADMIIEDPLRFFVYLALAAFVLYLSIKPSCFRIDGSMRRK